MINPRILVVDDQPINVQLLRRKLEQEGMRIVPAYSGREALQLVKEQPPDLILLDVMMPEMDGLEVCTILQADEETRSIPVIFITARNSKEGKLEGLGVGAVDYITKPIDLDETLARVLTQLRFVAINREMVDLQQRLAEARRAATIGAVTQGIAHNLNNLLGVVIGYLDLIKVNHDKPGRVLQNAECVDNAVQRIVSIIKQLSSLVVRNRLPSTRNQIGPLISGGISRYQTENNIVESPTIENPLAEAWINTHVEVFEDVLTKVLINAWESYGDAHMGPRPIHISAMAYNDPIAGESIEIHVSDSGMGIDPKLRESIFEPFISSKHTVGVGMGLTVARHALRNLGGDLSLEDNESKQGTTAILQHPIQPVVARRSR